MRAACLTALLILLLTPVCLAGDEKPEEEDAPKTAEATEEKLDSKEKLRLELVEAFNRVVDTHVAYEWRATGPVVKPDGDEPRFDAFELYRSADMIAIGGRRAGETGPPSLLMLISPTVWVMGEDGEHESICGPGTNVLLGGLRRSIAAVPPLPKAWIKGWSKFPRWRPSITLDLKRGEKEGATLNFGITLEANPAPSWLLREFWEALGLEPMGDGEHVALSRGEDRYRISRASGLIESIVFSWDGGTRTEGMYRVQPKITLASWRVRLEKLQRSAPNRAGWDMGRCLRAGFMVDLLRVAAEGAPLPDSANEVERAHLRTFARTLFDDVITREDARACWEEAQTRIASPPEEWKGLPKEELRARVLKLATEKLRMEWIVRLEECNFHRRGKGGSGGEVEEELKEKTLAWIASLEDALLELAQEYVARAAQLPEGK